jgi:GT2 family glycosyltransferase
LCARAREGYEVINLKRFIFYLSEAHTKAVCGGDRNLLASPAESIMQNAESGGSIAMAREAFFAIGGYDEAFVGWGGEDNEFWQRALTRKTWPYGYLPMAHLWHALQPGKYSQNRNTADQLQNLSSVPPGKRIEGLLRRDFGNSSKMDPAWPREDS